ncbi:MAG: polyprenyl synthetase family protein [Lactobacillaceae bacterium]|jgi:geranylgeranyl diphosphate synthase type II|nr:polyprenyl synthetase family protein [Lactobacillaceae bacterium]
MNFKDFAQTYKPQINAALEKSLEEYEDDIFLMMKYSLLSPGKRIRPLLTLLSYQEFSKNKINQDIIDASIPVEYIHSYSLVHDDLPEMDGDELRRGQETSWKKFGPGNAVLVGDGLQTFAFKIIANLNVPDIYKVKLVYNLAQASGPENMIRGQQYDLFSTDKINNIDDLEFMFLMKTGALMMYSATAGVVLAGGNQEQLRAMNVFGGNFGIAFQLRDDLDDATQTSDQPKNTSLKFKTSDGIENLIQEHKKIALDAITDLVSDVKPWNDLLELI